MEMIKSVKIAVDCVKNDDDSILRGGPEYLGFDFFVPNDASLQNMISFIKLTLASYDLPILNVYPTFKATVGKNVIWSKGEIVKCIANDADFIKSESVKQI